MWASKYEISSITPKSGANYLMKAIEIVFSCKLPQFKTITNVLQNGDSYWKANTGIH
jgi:hypothetical protein